MINYELYCQIKHYFASAGLTKSQIADKLELDVRTVSKYLTVKQYRPKQVITRISKLDPYKDTIVSLLEKHSLSAVQVLQRIREAGYDGGYTTVKDYVRKVRPKRYQAYLKLSFAPGECAQVDWGHYGTIQVGETQRRLSFFVMVLCYSRMMYVEFTLSQTMEHFLACHQNAFDFFKAVPRTIMVDNLKSAVIKRVLGEAPVFNPRYLDFADYYGFMIKACGVRKGNEKGRVESGVGYVKKNFLRGLDMPGFAALNAGAGNWLNHVANVRIHGETRQKPVELFTKEQDALLALPINPYDVARTETVRANSQFRVVLDTNYYSVPHEYANQRLILKIYPDRLCIYNEGKLIARHARCYERKRDFEDPDHPKALLMQRKNAREQKYLARFLSLSSCSEDYYRELAQRRMNPKHHVQKVVALSEIYGREAVARALTDAFELAAFSCEYIANILEQRARKLPEAGSLHLTRREDLLELDIPEHNLSAYEINES